MSTHADFISRHLDSLASECLSDFPYDRGRPLTVVAEGAVPSDTMIAAAFTRQLEARRFIFQSTETDPHTSGWEFLCRLDSSVLTLSDPQRASFLGKIWLRRSYDVGLSVSITDRENGERLWGHTIARSFTDRIPKSEAKDLSDSAYELLSPPIPATTLERMARPMVAGAAVGSVALLLVFLL